MDAAPMVAAAAGGAPAHSTAVSCQIKGSGVLVNAGWLQGAHLGTGQQHASVGGVH